MSALHDWLADQVVEWSAAHDDDAGRAIVAVRDLASVATLGSTAETTRRLAGYVEGLGSPATSAAFGTRLRTDPVSAALYNGTASQAFDFDDIAPACVSHVSAVMVPALAALAHRADSRRLLDGFVLGLRIIGRLAEAFTHEVYDRGIQPTHTTGPFGAVAGLAHALELDRDTTMAAFSLAATQSLGLRAHTGTRYKPVQAGVVASAAVRSVLLAEAGVQGGDDAVDVMLALIGLRPDEIEALHRDAPLAPVALAPKWYPTCGAAHTAIEATTALREQLADTSASTARLRVTVPPRVMEALEFPRPQSPDEARFSMEYCVATAWTFGAVEPAHFTTDIITTSPASELLGHVEVVLDDALTPPPTWSGFPAIIEAIASDGSVLGSARAERPLGYPERPLSEEQLRSKFVACASPVLGDDRSHAAFEALSGHDIFARLPDELRPEGDGS